MNVILSYRVRSFIFVCACMAVALVFSYDAHAMTVSPVRYDFEIAPGRNVQDSVRVLNDTDQREIFTLHAENFIANGEEGDQLYLPEDEPTDLASWIRFEEPSVTLDPGESADVLFTIEVPEESVPGGHYATLFFTRGGGRESGSVIGISEQVGVLLLVRVPGQIREEVVIESLRVKPDGILNDLPAIFETRVRNIGSVHLYPQGTVTVRNFLGNAIARIPLNPHHSAVLPNSVRRIESGWVKTPEILPGGFFAELRNEWRNFAFGRYTVLVEMAYGSQQVQLKGESISFWVFPWRLSLAFALSLIALIGLIRLYNTVVVRTAMKRLQRKK